ncbi:MAG: transglycosylase domain-containing protein [Roseicyclus sp.]
MSGSGQNRRPPPRGKRTLVAERRASRAASKPTRTGSGHGGSGGGRARKRRRAPRRRPRGPLGWIAAFIRLIVRLIWALAWRGAVAVILIVALATGYYFTTLPDVAAALDTRARGSVTMLDREGNVFAWRGDQFGGVIDPASASPHLVNAVIVTEDRRFYRHFGVSPRGIAGAIRINLREGRGPLEGHGGSTITQQVAKLMCLGVPYDAEAWESEADYEQDCRRTTIWRKIQEVPFSFAMELRYTKDEILSIYLNRAYLGAGARGFEAAAQRYFGVSATEVNPQQAAMLAGLLVAPSYYAPTRDLERAQRRAATVLALMEDEGHLTAAEAEVARADPATLSKAAGQTLGGFFADWVMAEGPDFLTRATTEDVVIRTTFDPQLQEAAEAALRAVFDSQVRDGSRAQAAIVVMSADGAVRAMVGGRDTRGAGLFNRASQAMRQTGSAFKPFVYATALDLGWRFDDMVLDAPLTIDVPGSGPYTPSNFSDRFYGEVTLTDALARSLNIPAVRLSEEVGRDLVRRVASEFGIESDLAAGPALALGASEATLIEMTGAYAGILNGGSAVLPYGVQEVRLVGDDRPVLEQRSGLRDRVISEQAARQLTYMMSEVVRSGTGGRAALPDRQAAGKTGTSQEQRDAWFVGFTADYVAGVWMGNDDNTPLAGVTGSGLPAEIWRRTMEGIHADLPPRPLPMIDPALEQRPPAVIEYRPGGQRPPVQDGGNPVENLLMDVLGGILGRN